MTVKRLKKFMAEQNLSVTQAGRLFGIGQPPLHRMVNGKRKGGVPRSLEKAIQFFVNMPEDKQKRFLAEAKKTPSSDGG